MVPLMYLWLPILLSAVIVFFASFLLHMLLPLHRGDYHKLPSEDGVMEALRQFRIPPGDYMLPHGGGPAAMKDPKFLEKRNRGPVAVMTLMPGGPIRMGSNLAKYFVFCVVVGVFAAYITGRALGPGIEYLRVFQFAGCVAFIAHAVGLWPLSIWYQRNWGTTIRYTIDGLLYGLLTGGVFGWLWPR